MRNNETVTTDGSSANRNNPDMMDIGRGDDNSHFVGGNQVDALGSATVVHKVEELPYNGQSVPEHGPIPQTDKQGMKIIGESGAGATDRDIND